MTHMLKKTLCLYLAWALVFFTFPVKILSQNPERIPVAILDLEGRCWSCHRRILTPWWAHLAS